MPYNFIEIDKNEQRCDYVRILQMKQDKPVRHTLDCASAITSYLTLHQIHRNRFGLASEIHQNITQLIFTIMRHRSQHSFPLNGINSFISALPFQFLFLVKWNDIFQRLSSKKCKWLSLKIDFFFFHHSRALFLCCAICTFLWLWCGTQALPNGFNNVPWSDDANDLMNFECERALFNIWLGHFLLSWFTLIIIDCFDLEKKLRGKNGLWF